MNAKIDGTFKPALAAPQSVTTCGECHAKGKEADNMKSVMDCTPCHSGNEHLMNKLKSACPLCKGGERTRMRPAVLPHLIWGIGRCPHKKGHVRSGKRRRHALFPCAPTQQTLVFMYPAQ